MSNGENKLDELLSDPMIQMVMARDRVRPEELRMLLERARGTQEPSLPPAHMIAQECKARWMCR
jgi:hypothetical protein